MVLTPLLSMVLISVVAFLFLRPVLAVTGNSTVSLLDAAIGSIADGGKIVGFPFSFITCSILSQDQVDEARLNQVLEYFFSQRGGHELQICPRELPIPENEDNFGVFVVSKPSTEDGDASRVSVSVSGEPDHENMFAAAQKLRELAGHDRDPANDEPRGPGRKRHEEAKQESKTAFLEEARKWMKIRYEKSGTIFSEQYTSDCGFHQRLMW